ncbi:NACHT and WD repeat domain-containing protein [Aspergillus mulundensis]|uniref:Nephrocystin 3-like N-terminal domain-containing protein n=1 Tax=Aspergillus mulundensis TaxID=1810919 RepID=A0A3D8R428_9EURO|nr:hypothetical protein DSM5745_08572 [Aspergillus mulundensis]RDW68812.1 hypothetical protein DSM5745_08572 [Aspergillus mulundensis]
MEPVGAAASIIAVIELSAKVTTILFQYSTAVKNAKPEIERLRGELHRLGTTLQGAQRLLNSPRGAHLKTSQAVSLSLDECRSELASLGDRLEEKLGSTSSRTMRKFGIRALKWPFESREVDRLIAGFERRRDTLLAALTIDQVEQVLDVSQTLVLSKLPVVEDAIFDSQTNEHDPRCHSETRIDLLQEIYNWVDDPSGKSIFWLQGMAGTGKSTVSRTVAQHFADRKALVGTFFFKRGEGERASAARFVTTITSQLIAISPALAVSVKAAIDADPAITRKPMGDQFDQLILKPLSLLKSRPGKSTTVLLVVDALDECGREEDIRRLVYHMSRGAGLDSVRWRAFLTGRPEQGVRIGFDAIRGEFEERALHLIPEDVIIHDLTAFFITELRKISDDYNCLCPGDSRLPPDWPGESVIRGLVQTAIPLFIFAATVCRFIGDRAWADPKAQLEKILQYRAAAQLRELDKLDATYLPILSQLNSTNKAAQQSLNVEFRLIVGSIVMLAEPLSANSLASILAVDPAVINRRLMSLHSVLGVPDSPTLPIKMLHLSFRDFLVDSDKRETNPLWIDEKAAHRNLANACFDLLFPGNNLKKNICGLTVPGMARTDIPDAVITTCLPPHARYACLYWVHHLERSDIQLNDQHRTLAFLTQHLLHWLEALSLLGCVSDSIAMIRSLQNLVAPRESAKIAAFLHDAKRFILSFRSIIALSPLQVYVSALAFAPRRSLVAQTFKPCMLNWITVAPGNEVLEWTALRQTLEATGVVVTALVLSPDDKMFASVSVDMIQLWDTTTGEEKLRSKVDGPIRDLAFSPDNIMIVATSAQGIVTCLDAATGKELQRWEHPSAVVAFSPDSQRVVCASRNRLCLRNPLTGQEELLKSGLGLTPVDVAFLPDGKKLLVAWVVEKEPSITGPTVSILDINSGQEERLELGQVKIDDSRKHPRPMLTLSTSGTAVAWVGPDEEIFLRHIVPDKKQQRLRDSRPSAYKLIFSPDGKLFASIDVNFVSIWDATTGQKVQDLDGLGFERVQCVALSSNSGTLALGYRNEIQIWDLEKQQAGQSHGIGSSMLVRADPQDIIADAATYQERAHTNFFTTVIFSPDGRYIASASLDHQHCLWDARTGTRIYTFSNPDKSLFTNLVFAANGKSFAASFDRTVLASNPGSAQEPRKFEHDGERWVSRIALSLCGGFLASVSRNIVHLWDMASSQKIHEFSHTHEVVRAVFPPIAAHTLVTLASNTIYMWEDVSCTEGRTKCTTKDMQGDVEEIAFSADGKAFAAISRYPDASERYIVSVWTIENNNLNDAQLYFQSEPGSFRDVALSSDGKTVACRDRKRKLHKIYSWDGLRSRMVTVKTPLLLHSSTISFSPDAQFLQTDYGRVSIDGSEPHKDLGYASLTEDWVMQGRNRVLWIPPDYREFKSVCHGNSFVLYYFNGRMIFIRVPDDPEGCLA